MFASVGYWIDQRYAGLGAVPTGVALVIDHCFRSAGLHRIEVDHVRAPLGQAPGHAVHDAGAVGAVDGERVPGGARIAGGLVVAASAWTRDVYRALRATREIRAGCVWVNDHIPIISEMPHGGMKESGFGKDMSTYSFEDYTVVKHVMFDITGVAAKPWHRTVFGGQR